MNVNKKFINRILFSNFLRVFLILILSLICLGLLDNGDTFESISLSMPTSVKSFSIYPISWYVLIKLICDVIYLYISLLIIKDIVKKNNYKLNNKAKTAISITIILWLIVTISLICVVYVIRNKANYVYSWADLLNIYYTLAFFAVFCISIFLIILIVESIAKKIQKEIAYKKGFGNKIKKSLGFARSSKNKQVFTKLAIVDHKYEDYQEDFSFQDINLENLCNEFCNYLWKRKKYYTPVSVQAFMSAMLNSRYIILRGKTNEVNCTDLPIYFARFINANLTKIDVLPTWRDEKDLIGFYNEYTKSYNATQFLKAVYEATYRTNTINMILMDEINNARVEKYFAPMLNQINSEKKVIDIQLDVKYNDYPVNAPYGQINCLDNNWFIGVEIRDDSKYRIPEKVYGLAYVVDIRTDNSLAENKVQDASTKDINYLSFIKAKDNAFASIQLEQKDIDFIDKLCAFLNDHFVALNKNAREDKYKNFLKMFYACGGNKRIGINKNLYALLTTYLDDSSISVKKEDLLYLKKRLMCYYESYDMQESIEMVDKMIDSMEK